MHKVSTWRSAFSTLANVQNEFFLKMKTKSFGNERLKCLLSQVQGDSDLQKIFEPIPLLKKESNKEKGNCNNDDRKKWKK